MEERSLLSVWLWRPLTGGKIHWSVSTPYGIHLATICGFDLANYVTIKARSDWANQVTCKECRTRMRFFWPGVTWCQPEDVELAEIVKNVEAYFRK